jgi:hypothetical protein
MFHEYVKLLIKNSRRISDENLTFTGNVSKLSEGFPKEYKGLEVKTGFGKGNWANVTWIGFLTEGQTIQTGIYPVYLYYRDKDVLILAYGVSETNKPNIEWPVTNAQTVKNYFAQNGSQLKKYTQSLVYKAYTAEDIRNITDEFDKDLNSLIDIYKAFMSPNTTKTSVNDNHQPEEQDSYIPLQTIYFGSPGTGKSFKIKDKILDGVDDNFIFRTTFHPDTDYASFVGCYKPITNKTKQSNIAYSIDELADIYKREVGPTEDLKTGHIEPRIKFGIEYCEYFGGSAANYDANKMLELAGKELAAGCQVDRVGITYVKYGINVGLKIGAGKNAGTITYDFAPQTFTNAYVKAWQNPTENVYLVIEEINRGNCAQIFGDLFQLLDRNDDGVSEYPIKADADLTKYLQDELGENHEGIADGKIKLPANLYILATMNTSDQSLFPMDSAFKRRWEWQYIPTSVIGDKKKILKVDNKEEKIILNKDQEQKVLKLGMYQYDWSLFLEKINKCITDATHSDDKQLGFWFVKTPKNSNEIKIETFVSKVIFYLWTDVFKDFGAKATNPFAFKNAEGGWVVCPFSSFFDPCTGEINLGQIHGFMYNLGIIPELEPEIQAAIEQNIAEEGNPEA